MSNIKQGAADLVHFEERFKDYQQLLTRSLSEPNHKDLEGRDTISVQNHLPIHMSARFYSGYKGARDPRTGPLKYIAANCRTTWRPRKGVPGGSEQTFERMYFEWHVGLKFEKWEVRTEWYPHERLFYPDDWLLFFSSATGAFVAAKRIPKDKDDEVIVQEHDLLQPNSIGLPKDLRPASGQSDYLIPPVSCVVGLGTIGGGTTMKTILHQQGWETANTSLTLPSRGTKKMVYTHTSGRTEETSDTKTLESALGISASVGWGGIGATISGSLNQSSSTTNTITTSESDSSTVSTEITNDGDHPRSYTYWQLVDRISVIATESIPLTVNPALATICSIQLPPLIEEHVLKVSR